MTKTILQSRIVLLNFFNIKSNNIGGSFKLILNTNSLLFYI